MYVYPSRDPISGEIHSIERAPFPRPWQHLRDLLIDIGRLQPIRDCDEAYLSIQTPDALRRIEAGDPAWEAMVPPVVADIVKTKKLFGYRPQEVAQS